jgi:hypothetical protein
VSFRGAAKRRARNPYSAANDMDSGLAPLARPGMTPDMVHPSREAYAPRALMFSPRTTTRGSGAPTGARVLRHPFRGPMTQARRRLRNASRSLANQLTQFAHPGNARLSALHVGDFLAPAAFARSATVLSGACPFRTCAVAEGRCCRAPPGCCLRGNAQDAGPVLLMHAVATSTLRGRDGTTISADHARSKHYLRLCAALLMGDVGSGRREPIVAQPRPQHFC